MTFDDLKKRYSELLNPIQQGLSQIGNAAVKAIVPGGANFSNIANNPQLQQRINTNVQNVSNAIGSNPIVKSVSRAKVPVPLLPPTLNNFVPTIGQLTQGRIIKPAVDTYQSTINAFNESKPVGERLLSGVNAGFNAAQFTPTMAAANLGGFGVYEGAKAGIKAARTGGNVGQEFANAYSGNNYVGAGDSITSNPLIAGALNVGELPAFLAQGKVKGLLENKSLMASLKGVSPNAFKIHPEDQALLKDVIGRFQAKQKVLPEDLKDIQNLAEHYLGEKFRTASTKKIMDAFDYVLASQNGGIHTTPFPKMGIVSNRTDTNIPLQENSGILAKGPQEIPGQLPPAQSGSSLGSPSSGSIAQVPNSQNPYFNTNKYSISPENKVKLNETIQEVKPQIEKVVGKKLSNQEVIQTADTSSKILNRVVDRSQTADFTARLLKTRQQLAAAADSGKVDKEYIDNLMAVKSHATDIARKLQSFSIGADPKLITSRDAILDAVLQVEKDTNKITEAAKGVDFNDLKQATDFYRKFVKPTKSEWVDLIRYNSMLSSPNTHINNAFSNVVNTSVVTPLTKTVTGGLDFLASKATGKAQTQFAGEGGAYVKGYISNLHDAAHAFADVLRGKTITGNLDVRQIPLSTDRRVSNLNLPTRLLEASDQFFTKLAVGGETAALNLRKSKGVNVGNIETKAADNAAYSLFRSQLHKEGQGHLLNGIDVFTGLIQQARNSKNPVASTIAKFTLPFVQTPMNILKQGIEYSPAGLATLPGAANKTEQLAKVIIGSSAAAATAMLVASGRTTWAEPADPTKKAAFRAAGMQPYAVKIGNNWVSYAKLPPALGFPIAFVSALHDAEQNKTIDQNQLDVILNTAAKYGNFFSDQSYLKNIGDLVTAAKGSPEAITSFVSNYPQQLVPYRALLGWMARLVDPYQRKINTDAGTLEKQTQQLFMQVPGLSVTVPARLDKAGNPIPNQNKEINAFSPLRVTTDVPAQKEYYDFLNQKSLNTKNLNILKKNPNLNVTVGQAGASDGTNSLDALKQKAKVSMEKQSVQMSGQAKVLSDGTIAYRNSNGNVSTIDLTPPTKGTGIDAFTNQNWQYTKIRDVYNAPIPDSMKQEVYKKFSVTPIQAEYDYKANKSNDIKSQYVLSKAQGMDHQALLKELAGGRQPSVSGAIFASDGVINSLAESGYLSKQEASYLKKLDYNTKTGQLKRASTGGSGKKRVAVKISIPKATRRTASAKTVTPVKQYKLVKPTLSNARIKKIKRLS